MVEALAGAGLSAPEDVAFLEHVPFAEILASVPGPDADSMAGLVLAAARHIASSKDAMSEKAYAYAVAVASRPLSLVPTLLRRASELVSGHVAQPWPLADCPGLSAEWARLERSVSSFAMRCVLSWAMRGDPAPPQPETILQRDVRLIDQAIGKVQDFFVNHCKDFAMWQELYGSGEAPPRRCLM